MSKIISITTKKSKDWEYKWNYNIPELTFFKARWINSVGKPGPIHYFFAGANGAIYNLCKSPKPSVWVRPKEMVQFKDYQECDVSMVFTPSGS